jgi:sugar phosphate isomerase/epimerase
MELTNVQIGLDPIREAPAFWADCFKKLRDAGIEATTAMIGCVGEDYTTIESIHNTGGVVPDETWPKSFANMKLAAPIASAAGIQAITMHSGFIPSDQNDPIYKKVIGRIREVADLFAANGLRIALETGQESAPTLLNFFQDVDRGNVTINFDPANMLLYGSGDPIESLKLLLPHVRSCHIKDANRSPTPGVWGVEVPVGTGQVDWTAFFTTLKSANFNGPMMVEREAGEQRLMDICTARDFVKKIQG